MLLIIVMIYSEGIVWGLIILLTYLMRICKYVVVKSSPLTHLSLASLLWDIGKQNSPRCDAAERGVPSGAILFANIIFIEKLNKM